jgi:multiple sugar transport system substrate-binding protein
VVVVVAAGGGGGDKNITFWLSEDVAQRVNAIQQIVNRFQQQSGVQVKVVADRRGPAGQPDPVGQRRRLLPDVMGPLSLGFVQNLATDDLADADAANQVVDSLGRDTFSERALSLVESDGKPMGVPSDTWTQLWSTARTSSRRPAWTPRTPSTRSSAAATKLKQAARTGSSPPPSPVTPSPSRPSSTSPSPTAASSPTTRAPSS